ncbi:MAG: hypothetical protein GX751_10590 [Desulfuromonadaceae bacterium]|nr:hypothetical protein [Desulfuromonadaceae bacterium]
MEKVALGTVVKTGDICPESGTWETDKGTSKQKKIKKGAKMPPQNFMAVNWELVSYDE